MMKIFTIFLFIFLLFWQVHENSKIEVPIVMLEGKKSFLLMPRKDRKCLEQLFYAILREDGGYTLLGSKPMHMFGCYKPFSMYDWDVFVRSISPRNLRIYRGWKTWQKYQHLLEKSEFKFWSENNPFWEKKSSSSNPAISIFLVNKKKINDAINTHFSDFGTVLHRTDITCDQLLSEAKNRSFFRDALRGHEGLIGTLFGYGRDNAWLFEEKEQGKDIHLEEVWGQEIDSFYERRPCFAWKYFGVCTNELGDMLGYPHFMVNSGSPETEQLKQKLRDARERILDYYTGRDLLEATLDILINGVPEDARTI